MGIGDSHRNLGSESEEGAAIFMPEIELKTWWVVMRPQEFLMESSLPFPLVLDPNNKMRRYLPVYDTYEEAFEDFPKGPIDAFREYRE